MRCYDCQQIIDDYFDGELKEPAKSEVKRHLETCLTCSRLLRELSTEEEIYSGYTPEIEISPELWKGVKARIGSRRSVLSAPFLSAPLPRVSAWLAAALVIIAIGLTVVFMKYVMRPEQSTNPQSAILKPSEPSSSAPEKSAPVPQNNAAAELHRSEKTETKLPESSGERVAIYRGKRLSSRNEQIIAKTKSPEQLVHEAEQRYLAAIAMLSRTVERRRSSVDPATLAKLEQALVSIDRTIAGTRKAVRQHPDDPIAVQYMLAAYSKKVDVLRQMSNY